MTGSKVLAIAATIPLCACSAALRRGLSTTEAATSVEQITRSGSNERDPAVSPDGKTLAFDVRATAEARPHIETVALNRLGVDTPARIGDTTGRQPAWMPDGSGLVFLSGDGSGQRLTQSFGVRGGAGFDADAGNPSFPGIWPAVSPDGRRVAMSVPRLEVFQTGWSSELAFDSALGISDLWGTGITILGEGSAPAWSPHGRRLAFARKTSGRAHIFVSRADGTEAIQLTDGPDDDVQPTWSPDGRSLAFCSGHSTPDGTNHSNIFVVHADASGLEQLTEGDREACRPDWAADGFIYFHANAADRFHIWRLRPRVEER